MDKEIDQIQKELDNLKTQRCDLICTISTDYSMCDSFYYNEKNNSYNMSGTWYCSDSYLVSYINEDPPKKKSKDISDKYIIRYGRETYQQVKDVYEKVQPIEEQIKELTSRLQELEKK